MREDALNIMREDALNIMREDALNIMREDALAFSETRILRLLRDLLSKFLTMTYPDQSFRKLHRGWICLHCAGPFSLY